MNDWKCPHCGGRWVRSFVFDHDRQACPIGKVEDMMQHADFEALGLWPTYNRPSTMSERILAEFIRGEPFPENVDAVTTVSRLAPGIHHRVVHGVDPDIISAEQAVAL